MSEIRKIADLAAEMGISERQFHRRLDALHPETCLKLRQEIIEERGDGWLSGFQWDLYKAATLFGRSDPDFSKACKAVCDMVGALRETPRAPYWWARDQRLLEEAEFKIAEKKRLKEEQIQRALELRARARNPHRFV